MSERSRRREIEGRRHLCAACRARKARYRYRGEVRADRQHVLCFQCFRSARERQRAWQIREANTPVNLTERQIDHRRAMLAHLERQTAEAR